MSLEDWPEVPGEYQPKRMYVSRTLTPLELEVLEKKGWAPMDVRLLPNRTDADKAESIKAWFEGVRLNSIEADSKVLKLIELEAKTYGLIGTKTISDKKGEDENISLDEMLDFKSTRAKLKSKPTQLPPRSGRRLKAILPNEDGATYEDQLYDESEDDVQFTKSMEKNPALFFNKNARKRMKKLNAERKKKA